MAPRRRSGSCRSIGLGLVAASTVVAISLTGSAMAGASHIPAGSTGARVHVSGGNDPAAIPGSKVFGNTPKNTPETVSFVLTEQHQAQLEASVQQGVSSFLSVSQFALEYGQTPAHIVALEQYLSTYGITTHVYADDVDVVATGTAGEFDKALSVQQQQVSVPAQPAKGGLQSIPAQVIHAATQAPELPSNIAGYVTAILGLSNYSAFASQAQHAMTAPSAGSSNACQQLSGLPSGCNVPANFATNYGLSPLYQESDVGQGQTIGIVTLAAVDPGAPQYFWKHVLGMTSSGRTVTIDNVDGGPGAPSNSGGSGESDLDVEQSGGVAPAANVIVYQAPNTDPGFADAFFDAASQNIAGSVSASWGESETYLTGSIASGTETSGYTAAFDEAFLEMAVQGQSAFASSGDSGPYDATGDLGTTNLAVDTPGDSPYITSSGGTTLPWSGTFTLPGAPTSPPVSVPQQRAWGWDYLWPAFAAMNGTTEKQVTIDPQNDGGGGGGFSVLYPAPTYQQGVSGANEFTGVQYLTPKDFVTVDGSSLPTRWKFNPAPGVSQGQASGRAQPDLAADADPFTGYLLYAPSFAQSGEPVLEGGWGGTSFVGPQLNGSTAVIDSYVGHRVGFWNPSIYKFAQQKNSPFIPLQQVGTTNDNLFYSGNPGALYNPSTGLGTPNLAALAVDFGKE